MPLQIPKTLYDQLRHHGEQTYPDECCGILLGHVAESTDGNGEPAITVAELIPAGNTRTDSAHNRYHIAPGELIAAQRQARKLSLDIVGFYHSHPDHPAMWSKTDFAEAHWFGCAYVITATDGNKTPNSARATLTNSFLLTGTTEDDKAFVPQPISISNP